MHASARRLSGAILFRSARDAEEAPLSEEPTRHPYIHVPITMSDCLHVDDALPTSTAGRRVLRVGIRGDSGEEDRRLQLEA